MTDSNQTKQPIEPGIEYPLDRYFSCQLRDPKTGLIRQYGYNPTRRLIRYFVGPDKFTVDYDIDHDQYWLQKGFSMSTDRLKMYNIFVEPDTAELIEIMVESLCRDLRKKAWSDYYNSAFVATWYGWRESLSGSIYHDVIARVEARIWPDFVAQVVEMTEKQLEMYKQDLKKYGFNDVVNKINAELRKRKQTADKADKKTDD